ncbi:MAG: hypothetical protein V1818_01650 [Candidatus Aenigmatarchaeota archaeon]
MKRIEHRPFPWPARTVDFRKTLKDIEDFVNKPGVIDVVSIISSAFGIIVWYKAVRTFKINEKKG